MVDVAYIRELVRQAEQAAGGRAALAAQWNISVQYIADISRGYRDPGKSILKAIGYERVVLYRKVANNEPPAQG